MTWRRYSGISWRVNNVFGLLIIGHLIPQSDQYWPIEWPGLEDDDYSYSAKYSGSHGIYNTVAFSDQTLLLTYYSYSVTMTLEDFIIIGYYLLAIVNGYWYYWRPKYWLTMTSISEGLLTCGYCQMIDEGCVLLWYYLDIDILFCCSVDSHPLTNWLLIHSYWFGQYSVLLANDVIDHIVTVILMTDGIVLDG